MHTPPEKLTERVPGVKETLGKMLLKSWTP